MPATFYVSNRYHSDISANATPQFPRTHVVPCMRSNKCNAFKWRQEIYCHLLCTSLRSLGPTTRFILYVQKWSKHRQTNINKNPFNFFLSKKAKKKQKKPWKHPVLQRKMKWKMSKTMVGTRSIVTTTTAVKKLYRHNAKIQMFHFFVSHCTAHTVDVCVCVCVLRVRCAHRKKHAALYIQCIQIGMLH